MSDGESSFASSSSDHSGTPRSDPPSVRQPSPAKRRLQVPRDYYPIAHSSNPDPCSVSALNAEEINPDDLWAIRLPVGLKPKHLVDLNLDLRSFNTAYPSIGPRKVGQLTAGTTDYDVFAECVPTGHKRGLAAQAQKQELAPETKEVSQLLPMLPNQRKDIEQAKIVAVPQATSRVIFFRRKLSLSGEPSTIRPSIITHKPCVVTPASKRPQPVSLEGRNIPSGADSIGIQYEMEPIFEHGETKTAFRTSPSKERKPLKRPKKAPKTPA